MGDNTERVVVSNATAAGVHPVRSTQPSDDPDLARIVAAWAYLPAVVRAGISAMVNATSPLSPSPETPNAR